MTLDIPRILDELRRSSLLAPAQVEALSSGDAVAGGDPDAFHAALQSLGALTPFQIDAVAADRTDFLIAGQSLITDSVGSHAGMDLYRVIDRTSRRPGILRRIVSGSLSDESLGVWRSAARIASQQRHPNLISVLETAKPSDPAWIIHEVVDGVDIESLVAEMGAIPPQMVVSFMRPVIEAVAVIHADGLCHGLISPSALILTPVQTTLTGGGEAATTTHRPVPGSIVRLDRLGLAVSLPGLMDATIGDGERLGDLAYAAPERLSVGGYTPEMDIYSLGACLYYLLTTKAPVDGHSLVDVLLELAEYKAPRPIELIRSDIPSSLTDTVRQMLSREPADRPTAAQLVARLRPAVPATSAPPTPPAEDESPSDILSTPAPLPMAMETMTRLPYEIPSATAMADLTYSGIDAQSQGSMEFVVVPSSQGVDPPFAIVPKPHIEPLDSGILAHKPTPTTESLSAWEMQGVAPQVESLSDFSPRERAPGPDVYAEADGDELPPVRVRRKEKMGRYWLMALAGLILNGIALGLALQFLILPGCRSVTTVKEVPATSKAKDVKKPR